MPLYEEEFKQQIAAAFIGTWMANNYNDYCGRGLHTELENPPVEDAQWLAEKALLAWKKHNVP